MATLQDLQDAIDALLALSVGGTPYQLARPVESEAYEAYVFGLCLRAVTELGTTAVLRGINSPPTPFIFRGSPGKIWAHGKNFGYAVFVLNGEEYEIHAGVEFKGVSGMTHELDVCIMKAKEAHRCRQPLPSRGDPANTSVVGGWECKFLSRLDKVHGRAFVGLLADMGTGARIRGICSNRAHAGLKKYLKPPGRPYHHFDLTPLNPAAEDNFVDRLKAELRQIAGL